MRARWLSGEGLGGRLCDAFYQNLPLYNFSITKQELNNVVNLHFINDKCKYRINKVEMGIASKDLSRRETIKAG